MMRRLSFFGAFLALAFAVVLVKLGPFFKTKQDPLVYLRATHQLEDGTKFTELSANLHDLVTNLKPGQKLPKKESGYRVVLTVRPDFIAEFYSLHKMGKVMEKQGWDYAILTDADKNQEAVGILNPDFIIAIRSDMQPVAGFINLLFIHSFTNQYANANGNFKKDEFGHLLNYDGFLTSLADLSALETFFRDHNKAFWSKQSYLSVAKTEFDSRPKEKLCFWGSALWDSARSSEKYLQLYSLLDQNDHFVLYGPEQTWKPLNLKSYKGFLPIQDDSLIQKIREAGIALLLHSHDHIASGVPTARIFEALAASAIIISDRHPFIEKHFGDSALYLDQTASAEEMYHQITKHLEWIKSNPELATQKARAAHTIFVEQFSLEKEIKEISQFVKQIENSINVRTNNQ